MIIVLTLPQFFAGESDQLIQLLESGKTDLIHLRKPGSSHDEFEALIRQLPSSLYDRLVTHDHFDLAEKYGLHGVHLNSRHPAEPECWKGAVSISCHSFKELAECRRHPYAYMSLSPIFDSISKPGYHSAFHREELESAHREGLIDQRVMALGGVTFSKIKEVMNLGFGGAMILGDAWKSC